MCEPATVLTVVAVVGAIGGAVQQQQQVDAENDYQKFIHSQNKEIADAAALREYESLMDRQLQEREAAAEAAADVRRRSLAASGTARAAAAESGTQGRSVAALLGDFERQELRLQSIGARNLSFTERQLAFERFVVRARQRGRILSTTPNRRLGPFDSTLGTLAVASNATAAGFSTYETYSTTANRGTGVE